MRNKKTLLIRGGKKAHIKTKQGRRKSRPCFVLRKAASAKTEAAGAKPTPVKGAWAPCLLAAAIVTATVIVSAAAAATDYDEKNNPKTRIISAASEATHNITSFRNKFSKPRH